MLIINILIAFFGLTATLAAFGGETWKKGDEPLIMRITRRGYIFEFSFFQEGSSSAQASDLKTIKLEVKNKIYDLHPGTGNLYYSGQIRIYGSDPTPITGYILNPNRLRGVKIKIYVSSTDATRGQQEFKKIVLNGQCSE